MTITLHQTNAELPPIQFGGINVPEAMCMKLLGVAFKLKLNVRDHIRSVLVCARRCLGLLH